MPKKSENTGNKEAKIEKSNANDKPSSSGAVVVKSGDKVKVEYTGTFDDGKVFDSSEKHGAPLEFEVGKGMIIPGFEKGVIGMKKGEEKTIHLEPCDAYGDHNPQLIKKVLRDQLPPGQEPKPGMFLVINLPNGAQFPARLTEVNEKEVTLDLNHPLAGKCLNFKFKIVEVNA
ncbi:peptidylprolyl isomerase [Candidatus Woesearchaeota archaeon]|nr:peptidylprolyl isomerase [Candidatus Woesearchaeota archaeon]